MTHTGLLARAADPLCGGAVRPGPAGVSEAQGAAVLLGAEGNQTGEAADEPGSLGKGDLGLRPGDVALGFEAQIGGTGRIHAVGTLVGSSGEQMSVDKIQRWWRDGATARGRLKDPAIRVSIAQLVFRGSPELRDELAERCRREKLDRKRTAR